MFRIRLYEAVCEGAPARFCAKVTRVRCERGLRAAQRELAMLDAARGLPGVVQLWRGGAGCPRRPRVHEFVDPATGDLCCAIVMRYAGCVASLRWRHEMAGLGLRLRMHEFLDPATSDLCCAIVMRCASCPGSLCCGMLMVDGRALQ